MVQIPSNDCALDACDGDDCSNHLVTSAHAVVVNSNGSSLVGVDAHLLTQCACGSHVFTPEENVCQVGKCANGGTCLQREHDFTYNYFLFRFRLFAHSSSTIECCRCECLPGFDGPMCEQTTHSFGGSGWAWYDSFEMCHESHTTLHFISKQFVIKRQLPGQHFHISIAT